MILPMVFFNLLFPSGKILKQFSNYMSIYRYMGQYSKLSSIVKYFKDIWVMAIFFIIINNVVVNAL